MADFDLSRLVKPLEFAPDDDPDCITAGNYDIWHEGHGYQVYFWSVVCGEPYPTLAAAQAAAQAHHVARVIAALDAELLSELVGALRITRDRLNSANHSEFDGVWSDADFAEETAEADAILTKLEVRP